MIAEVRARMDRAAGGRAITLIAVSKTQPAEAVEGLYRLGQRDFGENYVQELTEKAAELLRRGCTDIRWHFIGHLQTNKVKQVVPLAYAIHSVDSERLATEIAKRTTTDKTRVFVEVNLDAEGTKSGTTPESLEGLLRFIHATPELECVGLMCIPDPARVDLAAPFRRLRELQQKYAPMAGNSLSMGMTADFEAAIREGATHVRIGTALFGNRPIAK